MKISKYHKAELFFFLESPLQNIYQHTTDEQHWTDEIQRGWVTDPANQEQKWEVNSNFYHFKPQLSLLICKNICKMLYNFHSNSFFYLAIYWVPVYVQSTVLETARCTYKKKKNATMFKSTFKERSASQKTSRSFEFNPLVSYCAR